MTVSRDIIVPKTTCDAIQSKAASMGLTPNSQESMAKLINSLMKDIFQEISTFMKTDKAQELYSPKKRIDVKKFTAQDLFLTSLTSTLNEKLTELYPQAYVQQESWVTPLWSRVSYFFS